MATANPVPEVNFDNLIDTSPAGLADVLAGLANPFIGVDPEIATALVTAREALRAIAWNRYAAKKSRESAHRARVRRLRAHLGWRTRR